MYIRSNLEELFMKKMRIWTLCVLLLLNTGLRADEGMWLLPLIEKLNIDTMHAMGLKLTAEEIYSINHNSLKDAIVIFGGGCTGEIVSENGLLLTNHHCGFDAIQNHSTTEHNYLADGFWAGKYEEELPNPQLSATFLVRIEDVTDLVLSGIADTVPEDIRISRTAPRMDSIAEAAVAGTHYEARVRPFFGGNNYYLLVYEVFTDVRLVGTPPSSIGKFGYDTDNWVWPRHTGDFSVFRVYSGRDGKPAEYSEDNVPLKPKHYLPVSLKDRKMDDFAMVMGYPGRTNRYMTSWEIKELMSITNENRIEIRGQKQDILQRDMRADEKVNIQYASKYASSSNYWKYSIGQNLGLKRLGILAKKQQEEAEFTNWVNADTLRKGKYGHALNFIREAVEKRSSFTHAIQYVNECFLSGSEIIGFAYRSYGLYNALKNNPDNRELADSLARLLRARWEDFYKEYNVATDMKVVPVMLKLYFEQVPAEYHPGFYALINKKYKGDLNAYTEALFSRTIFADPKKFESFIRKPSLKILENDPALQAAISVLDVYRNVYYSEAAYDVIYDKGHRLYIAGLQEMHANRKLYPDANSTMRLTYGKVRDYVARDAVHYDYYTTLRGIMEKEDPDNWEFVVPEKLSELYQKQDYGQYGVNGTMPVCFITDNDITGGNSGSPVIDGEGNLIGLAFDGNWEAMSGDIVFEPQLQRCICVDIRYVLFIMDKFAGATHLVNEMKIVR